MSRENPFSETPKENIKKEPIRGDGFTMEEGIPFSNPVGPSLEFRPGESSDKMSAEEKKKIKERSIREKERTKNFSEVDYAEDLLSSMLETHKLETHNPYSETFLIKPDGRFEKSLRADGNPVYLVYANTPNELYQLAAEIEKKHPKYHFNFETDPEGKWFKYTVSKDTPDKEPLDPDFLQKQIHLPESRWDEEFRRLIREKIEGNKLEKIKAAKESPEVLREHTFRRYIEGLGLSENELRDKKVLDLGSGEGEFVKSLIVKRITAEAYGIDAELDEAGVENIFKKHLFRGNFEKNLPVKDADYIISVGAVSNGIWGGEEVMDIRKILENSIGSLREDGEIRIYPMQEAATATPLEGLGQSQQKWNELLSQISDTQKVEYRIKPRNIKVTGNGNDIILESVLIIRKKKKENI